MPKAAVASSPARIDIQIQRWPIERLKPQEGNARTHSNAQINQITASMKEFGWTNPILVDAEYGVIAGHARLLAAKKLGMKEVPVIVLAHLNEAQRRALVIADNQLAFNAGWDEELLRVELTILHEGDYNLELLGFDDTELSGWPEMGRGLAESYPTDIVNRATVACGGSLPMTNRSRVLS